MAEFWGDAATIARQKRLAARQDKVRDIPALANASRLLMLVDLSPDSWSAARDWIEEDGIVAAISPSEADFRIAVETHLGPDWDVHLWRAYSGDSETITAVTAEVMGATPLPDGWSVRYEEVPSDDDIDAFQTLNAACGVSPSPAAAMRAAPDRPALNLFIEDDKGGLKAVSSACMFFHPASAFGDTAFVGLVAVEEGARGLGLGKLANALVLHESRKRCGWERAVEFVHADNPASTAMVAASGLTWDGNLVAGIADRGMGRFTR